MFKNAYTYVMLILHVQSICIVSNMIIVSHCLADNASFKACPTTINRGQEAGAFDSTIFKPRRDLAERYVMVTFFSLFSARRGTVKNAFTELSQQAQMIQGQRMDKFSPPTRTLNIFDETPPA